MRELFLMDTESIINYDKNHILEIVAMRQEVEIVMEQEGIISQLIIPHCPHLRETVSSSDVLNSATTGILLYLIRDTFLCSQVLAVSFLPMLY